MCERERERERRRAEPGGERARARERACVRQRAGGLERRRQPPALPAARSCEARSESLLGPAGFRGGGLAACHARLGGDGAPLAGAFPRNLRLALRFPRL